MNISIYRRHECKQATGLCVVIDVLRAFTTAAYAFHRGAKEIQLVATKEEAFKRFHEDPSLMLMGEEHGKPVHGFHLTNSPFQMHMAEVNGRTLVQRTSAGTQGATLCTQASGMLIASFVVAEATIQYIQMVAPSQISLVVTGTKNGDEDLAFAEYVVERLQGNSVPLHPFLERVTNSPSGKLFRDPLKPEFVKEDLELALLANRFSFAMEVKKNDNGLIAQPKY